MAIGACSALLSALGMAPAGPSGRWLGQDGHDLVGTSPKAGPSDVQDLHFALGGLPPGAKVVAATVTGAGGGEWKFGHVVAGVAGPGREGPRRLDGRRLHRAVPAAETGRTFEIQLTFDDGRRSGDDPPIRGGRGGPSAPHALGTRLEARWVGQARRDLVGPGPNAGPDGLADAHVALARLGTKSEVRTIAVAGPGGLRWEFGPNPEVLPAPSWSAARPTRPAPTCSSTRRATSRARASSSRSRTPTARPTPRPWPPGSATRSGR